MGEMAYRFRPGGGGGGNANPPRPPPAEAVELFPSKLPEDDDDDDPELPAFFPSRPGILILNVCPSFRE